MENIINNYAATIVSIFQNVIKTYENNIEVTLNSPYTLKYSFSPENTTQKSLLCLLTWSFPLLTDITLNF